jgi:hypothetical protein
MAFAALRARSMILSSAERVMFIADPLTQHCLCAHMTCVKVGGLQNGPHEVSLLPLPTGSLIRAHVGAVAWPRPLPRPAHDARAQD